MTATETFYANLKPFDQFRGIFDPQNYVSLPEDWTVVITDIQGSTPAIQQGHYRQVNAVGVASIVAIINALKPLPIPFVFGGDGATLCIPASCAETVRAALLATQSMAREQFSLPLRIGMVPVPVIQQSPNRVLIAKCRVSEGYYQAAFTGEGLSYAESLVKNDPQGAYAIPADNIAHEADYSGFECRWKDVPSPHGETLSLLIKSVATTREQRNAVYLEVLDQIEQSYGGIETHRPVQKAGLELSTGTVGLLDEVKIRSGSASRLARWLYALLLPWKVRLGRYWMKTGSRALETDWGHYKDALVMNTDFRKFDDNLRMVISGNAAQRGRLERFLAAQYRHGSLVYGMHVSDRALMTCIISDYNLHHLHFIDGADGGYAMAARMLKSQLTARS